MAVSCFCISCLDRNHPPAAPTQTCQICLISVFTMKLTSWPGWILTVGESKVLKNLIFWRYRRIMQDVFACDTFSHRGISLWHTLGGERPATSVSDYPFDSRQCGQLYLPQGVGKRQLRQGMERSVSLGSNRRRLCVIQQCCPVTSINTCWLPETQKQLWALLKGKCVIFGAFESKKQH